MAKAAPKAAARRGTTTLDAYADGIVAGDRATLARAITLIESSKDEHQDLAQHLLQRLLPHAGRAHRIGITGTPGVGKSTAIDQLGMNLVDEGHRVAVLAIDPTSTRSGGSILGDKTRMTRLAQSRSAFIRPSPTSGTLGGVARKTRETMLLLEAAGFDVIVVETVGVGQSELAVAGMVDFFLVLLLAGGGDDLQGIKRGIVEMADMLAITKADGDNRERALKAAAVYQGALSILTPASAAWMPPVLTVSAKDNRGLEALWAKVVEHKEKMTASGAFQARRGEQAVAWLRDLLQDRMLAAVRASEPVARRLAELEGDVRAERVTPALAVAELMAMIGLGPRKHATGERMRRALSSMDGREAHARTTVLITGFGPFPGRAGQRHHAACPRACGAGGADVCRRAHRHGDPRHRMGGGATPSRPPARRSGARSGDTLRRLEPRARIRDRDAGLQPMPGLARCRRRLALRAVPCAGMVRRIWVRACRCDIW